MFSSIAILIIMSNRPLPISKREAKKLPKGTTLSLISQAFPTGTQLKICDLPAQSLHVNH